MIGELVRVVCKYNQNYPSVCLGEAESKRKSCKPCREIRARWPSIIRNKQNYHATSRLIKREAFEAYGGGYFVLAVEKESLIFLPLIM